MPVTVIEAKDAMLLGVAARFPRVAGKYLNQLDERVRGAGQVLVGGAEGDVDGQLYEDNQRLVDGLAKFGGKEVKRSKSNTDRVSLRPLRKQASARL
jgi:hypothetical protein